MQRSPEAEEAVKTPPKCLSAFTLSVLPLEEGGLPLAVDFALACKRCIGRTFRVFGFPSEDETLFQPPHRLECVSCKEERPLFDARTEGYDGVLNGGCAYESGEREEDALPGQYTVVVGVLYNILLDELQELSLEAKVNPSDLFDSINIVATPDDGGESITFTYECA